MKPSKSTPWPAASSCNRSWFKPIITSSGTNNPASMYSFAASPIGDPSFTAARNISPVDTCGLLVSSTILPACVPFPAPGGPKSTIDPTIDSPSGFVVLRQSLRIIRYSVRTRGEHKPPTDPLSNLRAPLLVVAALLQEAQVLEVEETEQMRK